MNIRNKIAVGLNKLARWIGDGVKPLPGAEKMPQLLETRAIAFDELRTMTIAMPDAPEDKIKRAAIMNISEDLIDYLEYRGKKDVPDNHTHFEYDFSLMVGREVA